jgi:hypothetical protein
MWFTRHPASAAGRFFLFRIRFRSVSTQDFSCVGCHLDSVHHSVLVLQVCARAVIHVRIGAYPSLVLEPLD